MYVARADHVMLVMHVACTEHDTWVMYVARSEHVMLVMYAAGAYAMLVMHVALVELDACGCNGRGSRRA